MLDATQEPTKQCVRCQHTLPMSDFHKHRLTKDGLQSYCKTCNAVMVFIALGIFARRRITHAMLRRCEPYCPLLQRRCPSCGKVRFTGEFLRNKGHEKRCRQCRYRRSTGKVALIAKLVAETTEKPCRKCGEVKPLDEFGLQEGGRLGRRSWCKKCEATKAKHAYATDEARRAVLKKYYEDHKEYYKEIKRKSKLKNKGNEKEKKWRLKIEVLAAYGGICVCCGESQPKLLCLDHVYNDGNIERKVLNLKGSWSLYPFLKRAGFPQGRYQVLCHNCNHAKYQYGVCPHQEGKGVVPPNLIDSRRAV